MSLKRLTLYLTEGGGEEEQQGERRRGGGGGGIARVRVRVRVRMGWAYPPAKKRQKITQGADKIKPPPPKKNHFSLGVHSCRMTYNPNTIYI